MYTYEQRMAAINLYIKYGYRIVPVIRELGYPNRHMLVKWYKEYWETGDLHKDCIRHKKHSEEEKTASLAILLGALQKYYSNDKCSWVPQSNHI